MTYPTAAVTTTNLDDGTDSPATARTDMLDAVQKLNQMIAHTTAFAATLLDDANAATALATLGAAAAGANADITSFSGLSDGGIPLAKVVNAAAKGANADITSLTAVTSLSGQGNALLINSATTSKPQVRQTVLAGPVDSSGMPSFGGGTGSTTVTASGTLIATAANGYSAGGGIDYTGSITNPSWPSLSTNGTMYLYLDIAAAGTCTTGSTTLAPTYRWGGADVVTSNQFTFNIQEMVGKVGNGSVATQTYRVFVGEVTVSGSVVTAITWYALMGRYQQAWVSTLPAAAVAVSANHNIGTVDLTAKLEVQNITAEFGFVAGDTVTEVNGNTGGVAAPISIYRTAKTIGFTNTNTSTMLVLNKTTGANATMTLANWKYRLIAQRSW